MTLVHDLEPELRAFGLFDPQAQNLLLAIEIESERDIDRCFDASLCLAGPLPFFGFWRDVAIVAMVIQLALVAHLVEIALWAAVLSLCGEFTRFAGAFYESAMNYTSLGYGDVVMSASWKLLAPLEAADGLLMFGVSTALIFAVIQRLVQSRFSVGEAGSV